MFQRRRNFALAFVLLLGGLSVGGVSAATAPELVQSSPGYSLASFRGDYGLVGTYGANVARLIGVYRADGNGHMKGTAMVNLPGLSPDRVVVSISYEGTYTIDENGTGIIHVTVALPGGGTEIATLDLVITKAEELNGRKVATEIADAQREPSSVVNGEFVTHMSTRRPEFKPREEE